MKLRDIGKFLQGVIDFIRGKKKEDEVEVVSNELPEGEVEFEDDFHFHPEIYPPDYPPLPVNILFGATWRDGDGFLYKPETDAVIGPPQWLPHTEDAVVYFMQGDGKGPRLVLRLSDTPHCGRPVWRFRFPRKIQRELHKRSNFYCFVEWRGASLFTKLIRHGSMRQGGPKNV